jgi:nicotinate phosphoribosyltransferase
VRDISSLSLLTDLYQLTMAYGYWSAGKIDEEAVFHLFFRSNPFDGGYAIAAGLEPAIEYLDGLRFTDADVAYLETLNGNDGKRLFPGEFLDFLLRLELTCDVDAIPEGTVVFPQEPLVRVTGSLIQAQIVESALLNLINFQTLIATKASRIVLAAEGDAVIDFGLRRAQGIDGSLGATRAAYIGGVAATSNVLAGARFGMPVRGTHAHSWVMSFDSEAEAFEAYARVLPNNCLLLVDTYDTLEGVTYAIEAGRKLRERGHELAGIRLDSGDLASLSIEARRMLDDAGFANASIVASNDLDEHLIAGLKEQGATINVWGVGTKLITGWDQPALGGVYKLGAVRRPGGEWEPRVKVSDQPIKTTNPGMLQVRRFTNGAEPVRDVICDVSSGSEEHDGLLVPVYRGGKRVYDPPPLTEIRAHRERQMAMFPPGIKRFSEPDRYPVELEPALFELKTRLIREASA